MRKILLFLLLPLTTWAQPYTSKEIARWEKQAAQVTIVRDQYGVPHIYGKTDADAVFGLLYAQCEDDFARVELNYVEKLGRMAELKGASMLYEDLLIRMIIDQKEARQDYDKAPQWLKKLCNAFADGVNYYLYKHPGKQTALLSRFEPWYPFLWTDGSIGAINTADLTPADLQRLYGTADGAITARATPAIQDEQEGILTGSNGFAFAPKITANGNAILYINPHVTFYFRPEVHMVSEEGLNAYGAVTWGQFFVYQGFNNFCGWMHTSCYVDAADTYIEQLSRKGDGWSYTYENSSRAATIKKIDLKYLDNGQQRERSFQTVYTHHGPVMAKRNGQYLSLRADNRITNGLVQCWQRTKATSFEAFRKTLDLKGNISNNTVYADAAGNIAYWHGNRIPKRNSAIDWTKPVNGWEAATEWQGLHTIDETVHLINPPNGWLQNCNSTPFTAAGGNSPKKADFPAYMAPDGENFRGVNAVRVLGSRQQYDLDKVIAAGYDTYLSAFEVLIPGLVNSFETKVKPEDSLFALLAGPVAVLKNWDYRCGEHSIATTLAVEWGQRILPAIFKMKVVEDEEDDQVAKAKLFAKETDPRVVLLPLLETVRDLEQRFGRWQLAWGTVNRFQRISPDIDNKFDDSRASIPVPFVSSTWGMLPSYTSRRYPGTNKRYGVNGNSFICAVEFGKTIRAKSLLAGGESGDPASAHFFDQAEMYSKGKFKEVYYYKEDVMVHAERAYHPGE